MRLTIVENSTGFQGGAIGDRLISAAIAPCSTVEDRRELGDTIGDRRAIRGIREQLAPVEALGAVARVAQAEGDGRRDGARERIDLADLRRVPGSEGRLG